MGLGKQPGVFKRLFESILPVRNRGNAGVFVTCAPHGAGLLGAAAKTLTAKATALNYGAVGAVLAATANTAPGWVEGVIFANPQVANKDYYVAVTTATAVTAAAQIMAEVPYHANLVTDVAYVPLQQPVYVPPNKALNCALAESSGGKTCDVWVVISRNK